MRHTIWCIYFVEKTEREHKAAKGTFKKRYEPLPCEGEVFLLFFKYIVLRQQNRRLKLTKASLFMFLCHLFEWPINMMIILHSSLTFFPYT